METTTITENNAKHIDQKKATGKKEKVIIVPPNPAKDQKRKKEYNEVLTRIQIWSVPMANNEFKSLRAGSRFSWIETIDIYQNFVNDKWHSIEDRRRQQAYLYVFHYDAKEPGFIHKSLYLHSDGKLFKPNDIKEVNKIVEHLKIVWLYEFERYLTWDAEYEIRKAKREKEEAQKKAKKEALKKEREKLKAEAAKKKPLKKVKSKTKKAVANT